jgi:hydrogenase small subunit
MPGFPEKFMPFMNQPPGSMLSSQALLKYGAVIRALRAFTKGSLNKIPSWRRSHDGYAQETVDDEATTIDAASS